MYSLHLKKEALTKYDLKGTGCDIISVPEENVVQNSADLINSVEDCSVSKPS